jgi:1-acyl-sn-glycerol-3-phosphate acyltransferase
VNTVAAGALAALVRFATGVVVERPHGPVAPGGRVYFANHTSHLDGPLVWATLPAEQRLRTRVVGARDYWGCGWRRPLAARLPVVLIDRHGLDVTGRARQVEVLLEALDDDGSLVLFPEGTRGSEELPAAFRTGLYHLARRRPGLPLVPVHLAGCHRMLPRGAWLPAPVVPRVRFGRPLSLAPDEDRDAFLQRCRAAVCALAAPPPDAAPVPAPAAAWRRRPA